MPPYHVADVSRRWHDIQSYSSTARYGRKRWERVSAMLAYLSSTFDPIVSPLAERRHLRRGVAGRNVMHAPHLQLLTRIDHLSGRVVTDARPVAAMLG